MVTGGDWRTSGSRQEGLARWTRFCASHPWRVVLGWLGDRRRPHRARRDRRRLAAGRVRDPGLRHAAGDRPDRGGVRRRAGRRSQRRLRRARGRAARHGGAQGGDRRGTREPEDLRVQADRGEGGAHERRRPVQRADVRRERADRIRRGPVRPGDLRRGPRVGRRGAGRRARGSRARGRDGRVQRRRRVPADRAGHLRAARSPRGDHRPADRLPDVRGGVHPDRARDRRARDGVPPALHPRGPDRHQHDHADPRLDDRAGRRDRLLALHRDPVPAAAARRAVAAGRGRRGGRLRRPRGALRGPHGRDRRDRARVLRARLRHEARDRQRARRADHRAARELAPDLGAAPARPQGRPAQAPVPAEARRLRGGDASGRSSPAGAGS